MGGFECEGRGSWLVEWEEDEVVLCCWFAVDSKE